MKNFRWLDVFFCTLFIFGFIGFAYLVPARFDALNPLSEALSDFELTDLIFSESTGLQAPANADTNIVLVNIGGLSRDGIAEQIRIISKSEPKAIGIDVIFEKNKAPLTDSNLSAALRNAGCPIILVNKLVGFNDSLNRFDSVLNSIPMFARYSQSGFANLITEGEQSFRTARLFSPVENTAKGPEYAFAFRLANILDSGAAAKFLARQNPVEIIYYKRNQAKYYALDVADIFNPELNFNFHNKIVLLGFMGNDFGSLSWEDKFYTPLNAKYAGKALPDMFGVVVHANIISMIREQNFIDDMPKWLSVFWAIILCILNVALFLYIHEKVPNLYDVFTKICQFVEALLLLLLLLVIFQLFNYKADLTLALAAVLLAGDLLEVYIGGVKRLFELLKEKFLFLRYKKRIS